MKGNVLVILVNLHDAIVVAEIIRFASNSAQMYYAQLAVLFSFFHISQIARVQGYAKISKCITAHGGKFFKINFYMVIVHKIKRNLCILLGCFYICFDMVWQ